MKNPYAVILERTMPSGKRRWFNIQYCDTPEQANGKAALLTASYPECKYGVALSDRNKDYDDFVSYVMANMCDKIAVERKYYCIKYQPFAINFVLPIARMRFENEYWKLDSPCQFELDMQEMAYDATDSFGMMMLWSWKHDRIVPTPVDRLNPFDTDTFWTDTMCDKYFWFEVRSNRFEYPGIFEPDVDMFVEWCKQTGHEIPKAGELRIWYSPWKGTRIGTDSFSAVFVNGKPRLYQGEYI